MQDLHKLQGIPVEEYNKMQFEMVKPMELVKLYDGETLLHEFVFVPNPVKPEEIVIFDKVTKEYFGNKVGA